MGAEGKIRRAILELDVLDAVIGLGPNLFYGTGLAASILVFRAHKQPDRVGKVLLIDASSLFKRGRNQNTLEPEHRAQIFQWYQAYQDVEGAGRVVSLDEIADNDWNLNIPRYVEPVIEAETVTVAEAVANLRQALDEAYAAEDKLKQLLNEAGLMPG
jgi:type I restriction enzyme M protein